MFCSLCATRFPAFVPYGVPPRPGRCPSCGAKPRHRAVVWYLREVVRPRLGRGARVVEVGPARAGVRFHADPGVLGAAGYTAIDVRALDSYRTLAPPYRFLEMYVTRMEFRDSSIDVILCNNTLPYVADDARALAEIARCLRNDGLAMLETHREPGPTRRVSQYRAAHPELGDEFFAANGDQWVYGDDLLERIEAAGLAPRVDRLFAQLSASELAEQGLKDPTELLVAFKSERGAARFGMP